MSGFHFINDGWVPTLLWSVVGITIILVWLEFRSRAALSQFLSPAMLSRLSTTETNGRRLLRMLCIAGCLILGATALARPAVRGASTVHHEGVPSADIVVALDVSKSMLATDAPPNRLARAKAELSELTQKMQGHRIALVPFAGRAAIGSALTSDEDFFRQALRTTDTSSAGLGGTNIGEALRKSMQILDDRGRARIILLITDGEDHDSVPMEVAKEAKASGVRIVTIGFGSEDGAPLVIKDPQTGEKKPIMDGNGQQVISKLDGELLRKIALETDGAYVPAQTDSLNLESILKELLEPMIQESQPIAFSVQHKELYPWFVLSAFLFAGFAALLRSARRSS